jgi:TetR/AcrR family transcriptional repressor of mexJK operon
MYKHFADKAGLFHELITATVQATGEPVAEEPVLSGEEPVDELHAFARHLLNGVMQPRVLQLRRLVIGEASRFPALGRAFYDLGVGRTTDMLAEFLDGLAGNGTLHLEDPRMAAEHYIWLALSIPLNRAMLTGEDRGTSPEDFDLYADAGVTTFLAAYAG